MAISVSFVVRVTVAIRSIISDDSLPRGND